MKRLVLGCLVALSLFAHSLFADSASTKWEYLVAGDCSVATETCFVGHDASRKIVALRELGGMGWELVSVLTDSRILVMIFKRPSPAK